MSTQIKPASTIESRIARLKARIAKWDKEATEVGTPWIGAPAYKKFCEDMARAAREMLTELETTIRPLAQESESMPGLIPNGA